MASTVPSDSDTPPTAEFKFYKALSMRVLAERLAHDIKSVQKPVGAKFSLEPEFVLVSNRAQGIWLQQVIAERNGICANVEFLLVGKFLGSRIGKRGKEAGSVDPFASNPLTLRIFKLLREKRDKEEKEEKALPFSFRENSDEDLIAVASKLAEVLASYQMLRPEMIEEWQRGANDSVESAEDVPESFLEEYRRQKKLWMELGFKSEELPAIRYLEFLSGKLKNVDLPKRVFVFAPSSLPSMHFKLLKKLSEQMPVYFYYHNLSKDLWTELESEKQILRSAARSKDEEAEFVRRLEEVQSEPAKELLLLWGKAARPLARALIDESLLDSLQDEAGNELPGYDTLLHAMQSVICRVPDDSNRQSILSADESLLVHVAPSMLREVEILYDDLVRLFDSNKDLREKDVLIMFPNVEEYAPLIHAVFTKSAFPHYSIADRLTVENFPGISAFFALLRVASGDVRVTEISGLLEMTPIARKLGLSTEEIPELQKFLRESNAHWGLSEKDRREKLGVTSTAVDAERFFFNNSLAFGLRRGALGVMLGNENYSVPSEPTTEPSPREAIRGPAARERGENEILKFGSLEISESDVSKTAETAGMLGKLSKLLRGIEKLRGELLDGEKKEISYWCNFFHETVIDELLEIEDPGESERLKSALNDIKEGNEKLGVKCKASVVVELLKARSWEQLHDRGMLGGGLTFCSLQPLRNIPARAIYVGGMGWGKFPHGGSQSTLDLVSNWPTALRGKWDNWDTTAKERDNLLLLEILLSAKDYLRFSYVGNDVVSHGKIPPAPALEKVIEISEKVPSPRDCVPQERPSPDCALEESEPLGSTPERVQSEYRAEATPRHCSKEQSRRDYAADTERERHPAIVCYHKLHTYDPEEQSFCDIALAMGDKQAEDDTPNATPKLTSFPLTEDEMKKFETLRLEELIDFFVDPAKFLCKKRLNLKSDWRDEPLSDDDPDETRLELRDNVLKFFEEISKEKPKPFSFEEFLNKAKGTVKRETILARARGELSAFTDEESVLEGLVDSGGIDPKSKFATTVLEIFCGKKKGKKKKGEDEEMMTRVVEPLESAPLSSDLSIELGKHKQDVTLSWNFKNVFKLGGEMVFVVFPKKKEEWGRGVYATVAAALISKKYESFKVVATDGKGKSTVVTAPSLAASGLTLEEIVSEFFKGLETPPLLFWETPFVKLKKKDKGSNEDSNEEPEVDEDGYYKEAKKNLLAPPSYTGDKNSPSVAPAESMEMQLVFGKDLSKSCMPLLEKSLTFVKKISIAVGKL